jgi:hypothetical protein
MRFELFRCEDGGHVQLKSSFFHPLIIVIE